MSPTVIRNAGLKMEINVKNMQYPMGENVTEEFYKMVGIIFKIISIDFINSSEY